MIEFVSWRISELVNSIHQLTNSLIHQFSVLRLQDLVDQKEIRQQRAQMN